MAATMHVFLLSVNRRLATALSIKTLRNWRLSGCGPCRLKVGRLVRYRLSDVRAWLETRVRKYGARCARMELKPS